MGPVRIRRRADARRRVRENESKFKSKNDVIIIQADISICSGRGESDARAVYRMKNIQRPRKLFLII